MNKIHPALAELGWAILVEADRDDLCETRGPNCDTHAYYIEEESNLSLCADCLAVYLAKKLKEGWRISMTPKPSFLYSLLNLVLDRFNWARRRIRWWYQRRTRGFDDTDLWSLDHTLAKIILPRLKEFRKDLVSYPVVFSHLDNPAEEWDAILRKMIRAFELIADDTYMNDIRENGPLGEINEGLDLFREYFLDLWD